MTLKKRAEMTKQELAERTLHLECEACGFYYDLAPTIADVDDPNKAAYYSSDKDFCPKCGASDIRRAA